MGGGYVILPLLQFELVEKRKWITDDELCEYYALSQSIPGIIATNLSIFVGYKLKKTMGALAAVLGITAPAFLSIVIIAKILNEIVELKFIENIFWGVGIGVLMLIFLAVKEIWRKSVVDKFSCGIFFVTFILSCGFKAPPSALIILAIFIGLWLQFQKKFEKGEEK